MVSSMFSPPHISIPRSRPPISKKKSRRIAQVPMLHGLLTHVWAYKEKRLFLCEKSEFSLTRKVQWDPIFLCNSLNIQKRIRETSRRRTSDLSRKCTPTRSSRSLRYSEAKIKRQKISRQLWVFVVSHHSKCWTIFGQAQVSTLSSDENGAHVKSAPALNNETAT